MGDETEMEVRINASEYKPEELKVSIQSGRRLLQEQLERWMDDPEPKPEPIQGVPHHAQRGGNQGGRGRDQDGGEDQRLGVQASGAEGVRTVRTTSRRRKARGEERRRQCLCQEEFLEELHPSQGGSGGPDGLQTL